MLASVAGLWLAVVADEAYLVRWTLFATLVSAACMALAVLLRRPLPIPIGVLTLGLPYVAIVTLEHDALDTHVPLLGALLFGATELAYWSLELRGALTDEPGTYLRRLALIASLVFATFLGGTVVLALVERFSAQGATVDVLGAAAAMAAVALLTLAAASRRAG